MIVWIVLPAYNEGTNLPAVFEGLRTLAQEQRWELRIILVDDGSTDGTARVAKMSAGNLPLEILSNGTNRGLAFTFRRGMMAAAEQAQSGDVIFCMDADNSHPPGVMERMMRMIKEGKDVVVASRYQTGAIVKGVPVYRRFISRIMSLLFHCIYPIEGVRDYSCGYRAYRADFLKRAIDLRSNSLFVLDGFACMVGILLRLAQLGAVCGEVPTILRYDLKQGASKMHVTITVLKTLKVLLQEKLQKKYKSKQKGK
jgi:dolichol-phosphate mannosyltransferase